MRRLLVGVSLLFLVAAGGFFWWQWAVSPVCQVDCQPQIFIVKKGESLSSIAQRLEDNRLIRSSTAFRLLAGRLGITSKIQAGDFRLNPAMRLEAIGLEMTHGTLDRWVTLIEGLRREEIAEKLNQSGLESFDEAEFLAFTKNLEGKLFPDTYLIPKQADAQQVSLMLTRNFEKRTADLKLGSQSLVLASILEREVRHEKDLPIITGILFKRLGAGWPLQVDAAVQYAVANVKCQMSNVKCDWWPQNLTKEDLRIKSPYNTYLNRGLPPAPISNPGLAAIKAALNPAETDYWFYLSDKQGEMHYARTIEEHNQNIATYLR